MPINKAIFKKKIDYTMSAISGIQGLKPTIEMIKYSENIAIANKESIICAWDLIKKKLIKYKTEFIPIDSEHFSIWEILKGFKINNVDGVLVGGASLNSDEFLKIINNSM